MRILTRSLLRYGGAVAAVGLMMVVKQLTDTLFGGGPPLILFLVAVMIITRYSGTGPGLLATALSVLVCDYCYFPPAGSLKIHSTNDAFRLTVFVLESATLCALMESFRATKNRAEQSMREALSQEDARRESESQFRLLVESVTDYAIIMLDPDGRVVSWNAGAERIKGYRAEEIVGRHFSCFYPAEDVQDNKSGRKLAVATAEGRVEDEGWRVRKDGSRFWANVVITAVRDDAGRLRGFSKVTRDFTERRRQERRLALQYAVTSVLSESDTRDDAIPEILAAIGDGLGWAFGALWSLDRDAQVLRCAETWKSPALDLSAFEALSRRTTFSSGIELPGHVWAGGEPAWVTDVVHDKNFPRASIAAQVGLHGGLSFPVRIDDGMLSVLEFFSPETQPQDDDLIRMLPALGSQIGQFTARKQAEVALRKANEQLRIELAERRRVEGELKASEKLFRSLSASSPIGIFQTDAEGLGIYANERCLSITGLATDEILGHGWNKTVHPEDRDEVFAEWMTASHAGRDFSREYRVLTANGEVVWVHARAAVIPPEDGVLSGHVGTLEDVTARKRADEYLRRQAAALQEQADLLDLARDMIMVRDLDGTIRSWNRGAEESYGWAKDEAVGKPTHDLLRTEFPKPLEEIEAELRREGRWEGELTHTTKDGTRLVVDSRWSYWRDEQGQTARVLEINSDVTERKRTEAAIMQARQAAEAANRAKSEFLANMSHEIRTPMNGVLGMLDLTLRSSLQPRQREFLTLAKSSAETLLRLLNDILDFSKIEAGRLELESTPFSLREALGDTLKALALQVHEKGLELTHSVAPDVPDAVLGDPGRLSQILVNLVGNAQKFTERGEVAVRVELGPRAGGAVGLHVSVRDTGIGIPPEKLTHVFAAFTQADSSTTRQFGGTGLGLTICSHLVQAMGGRIWVESVVGRGSTFHFTVRLGLQEAGTARPAPVRVNLDGLPVLVVDDNATHRLVLGELVAAWGMKPTAVDGGPAAIAAMRHARDADEPYSLVLLDVLMPGMDGFEVAEWIQRDAELAGTAIMMLSSADYRGDAGRCRAVGAAAFLRKPIKESELLDTILEVLGLATPARAGSPTADTPAPPPPSVRLRILLAEDTPVNQRLAITLLEDRGHSVVVANDGQEALDILGREPFDLILMDVQMPRMDGFQATAAIRAGEAGTDRRMPILAMTAHAMKGDKERCLASGMDGYISKPIRAEQFLATVEGRATTADVPEREGNRGPRPDVAAMVFDLPGALARARGKRPLLRKMAELFLADCPGLLDQVRAALAAGDAPMLERAAHRMKGSAANLSALRVVEVAGRLEAIGRDGPLVGADAAYAELEDEIVHLGLALEILKEEDAVCKS